MLDIRKVYKVRKSVMDCTIAQWGRLEHFCVNNYIDICPVDFYYHIGRATYCRREGLTADEKLFFKALNKVINEA